MLSVSAGTVPPWDDLERSLGRHGDGCEGPEREMDEVSESREGNGEEERSGGGQQRDSGQRVRGVKSKEPREVERVQRRERTWEHDQAPLAIARHGEMRRIAEEQGLAHSGACWTAQAGS